MTEKINNNQKGEKERRILRQEVRKKIHMKD
jgi:hypothetical protein